MGALERKRTAGARALFLLPLAGRSGRGFFSSRSSFFSSRSSFFSGRSGFFSSGLNGRRFFSGRRFFHGRGFDFRFRLGGRRVGGQFGGGGGAVFFTLGAFSGAFLGLLARLALGRVVAVGPLHEAFLGQEARDAVGRLGALLDPGFDRFQLQGDADRIVLLEERVVGADLLDETAVAGRVAVSDDDRVVGALLGAATGQTNLQHFKASPWSWFSFS
jgi:hypothetical protein